MLPPTEAAFMQHLKRAALATLRDKLALSPKPDLPLFDNFGWELTEGLLKPVPSTDPMWPDEMLKALTCNCEKGCSRNCPCEKRNVACFVGCLCTGTKETCYRAKAAFQSESEDDKEGE